MQRTLLSLFVLIITISFAACNIKQPKAPQPQAVDGAGNSGLIGADINNTVTATPETMNRLKPYYLSSEKSEYLDHTHAQNDVTCKDCHGKPFPDNPASMDACLRCHGTYEKLAELTKGMPYNPHDSHLGEIRCTLCHMAHEKSVSYCTKCHELDS